MELFKKNALHEINKTINKSQGIAEPVLNLIQDQARNDGM
jgi:hypothetical protein